MATTLDEEATRSIRAEEAPDGRRQRGDRWRSRMGWGRVLDTSLPSHHGRPNGSRQFLFSRLWRLPCHLSSGLRALPCRGGGGDTPSFSSLCSTTWPGPTQLMLCSSCATASSPPHTPLSLCLLLPWLTGNDLLTSFHSAGLCSRHLFPKSLDSFLHFLRHCSHLESHFSSLLPPEFYLLSILSKIKWGEENKTQQQQQKYHITRDYYKRQMTSRCLSGE